MSVFLDDGDKNRGSDCAVGNSRVGMVIDELIRMGRVAQRGSAGDRHEAAAPYRLTAAPMTRATHVPDSGLTLRVKNYGSLQRIFESGFLQSACFRGCSRVRRYPYIWAAGEFCDGSGKSVLKVSV
ncbi:MAG: hypothetical protein ACLURV_04135 [Gallintestinimicrobium sp.]